MLPLRLVLGTNIVVSAAIRPDGLQRSLLLLALTRPARLYVTAAILAEYRTILARPELGIRKGLRRQYFQLIENGSHMVRPRVSLSVTIDPRDNIFLECADAGRADYLVTGNTRHFPRFWKQTKIVTSREFMTLIAPHLTS